MDSPLSPVKNINNQQRINFKMEYLVYKSKRYLKPLKISKNDIKIKRNLVKLKYFY
jgi:hypothetical protein